jgi:hypothetical protein
VNPEVTALQLGLTCKKIHHEVIDAKLFYRWNVFRFYGSYPAVRFLKSIESPKRNSIRSISLRFPQGDNPTQVLDLLSNCTDLRFLKLTTHDFPPVDTGVAMFQSIYRLRGIKFLRLSTRIIDTVPNLVSSKIPLKCLASDERKDDCEREIAKWHMEIRKLITQERTRKTDRRAAAAAAIECYCPNPRVLRYGRGKICRCQERKHPKLPLQTKLKPGSSLVSVLFDALKLFLR